MSFLGEKGSDSHNPSVVKENGGGWRDLPWEGGRGMRLCGQGVGKSRNSSYVWM